MRQLSPALLTLAMIALLPGRVAAAPLLPGRVAAAPLLIILDPGHGGSNKGAYGPATKRHEKLLTLSVARMAAKQLRGALPTAEIQLTRYRDRYLSLQQRVRRANQLLIAARKAQPGTVAAFVSIHFNASPSRSQQGFESYVLNHSASDREAKRLALAANPTANPTANPQTSTASRNIAAILADVQQRGLQQQSMRLAEGIQQELQGLRGKRHNRGLRQASFDVLMGLRMPAVLVELAFIDHPLEGAVLAEEKELQAFAEALSGALARFLRAAQ